MWGHGIIKPAEAKPIHLGRAELAVLQMSLSLATFAISALAIHILDLN